MPRDIPREPITDEVLEQLERVAESDQVDDLHNWMGVQAVAHDLGCSDLAMFIVDADAVTYHEAVRQVTEE